MNKVYLILSFCCFSLSISCQNVPRTNNVDQKEEIKDKKTDTIQMSETDSLSLLPKEEPKVEDKKQILYTSWAIKKNDSLRKVFDKKFSKEEKYIIAALNRTDLAHLKRRDSLMVPSEFLDSFLEYSPFPSQVAILQDVNKCVIFSYPIQAFAVYEKGTLVKWGPTNMGKKSTQTPRGLFFTNWKGKEVRSTVDNSWILRWNFNVSNHGGVGWHQYRLPGYPVSHSCMRLLEEDAKWLYGWADQWVLKNSSTVLVEGNPVIVYGDYDFSTNGIWHKLAQNPEITNISEADLTKEIEPFKDKILKKQEKRERYFAKKLGKEESKEQEE